MFNGNHANASPNHILLGRVREALSLGAHNNVTDDEDDDPEGSTSSDESDLFNHTTRNIYHTSIRPNRNGLDSHNQHHDSDEEIHISEEEEEESDSDERYPGHNPRRYTAAAKGKHRSTANHGHGTRAAMASQPNAGSEAYSSMKERRFFTNDVHGSKFFSGNGKLTNVRPRLWDGKPVYDFPYGMSGVTVL